MGFPEHLSINDSFVSFEEWQGSMAGHILL